MKNTSRDLHLVTSALRPGSLVSLKDYLAGRDHAPNPYASIDDFLDETWCSAISSIRDDNEPMPRLS